MSWVQKVMRVLAPACEKQRMEFRKERARLAATAEDLNRTVMGLDSKQIQVAMEKLRNGNTPNQ